MQMLLLPVLELDDLIKHLRWTSFLFEKTVTQNPFTIFAKNSILHICFVLVSQNLQHFLAADLCFRVKT